MNARLLSAPLLFMDVKNGAWFCVFVFPFLAGSSRLVPIRPRFRRPKDLQLKVYMRRFKKKTKLAGKEKTLELCRSWKLYAFGEKLAFLGAVCGWLWSVFWLVRQWSLNPWRKVQLDACVLRAVLWSLGARGGVLLRDSLYLRNNPWERKLFTLHTQLQLSGGRGKVARL